MGRMNLDAGEIATMRAVVIDSFGGPEQLHQRQVPVPSPGPGQVLIGLEMAGVGSWDPFERERGYAEMQATPPSFPYVLGSEGAGTIAAVGDGVESRAVGECVFAASFLNLDAALLTAGGPEADAVVAAVRPGGRAAYPTGVQPEPASTPGVKPQAFNGEPDAELLERFMDLIGDRPLDVHIAREFTLDQIPAAHHACANTIWASWQSPSPEAAVTTADRR